MNARSASHVLVWPLLLMFGASGSAASFTVSTTNDTGAGSFRQALVDANASADALSEAIEAAMNTADAMELELTGTDEY